MKTKTPLSILFFLLLAVATTWAETINLATVMTDKSLKDGKELKVADGDVLTGTLSGNLKILIASNATVTLNGVTINGDNNSKYQWAGLTCEGNCNIVLAEKSKNIVKGFYETYPGIYVPQVGNHMLNNNTLTISGTGSLEASSNGEGAGIGAGYNIDCGNITISGGIVTATGGSNAAGIGGGYFASVENITISGGIVTATGGSHAAGIGAGNSASVGNITIGGDKMMVTAIGGGICSIDKGHSGFSESKITIDGIATSNICKNPYVYDNRMHLTHTDISVAAIADQTYTGSEICPEVRVADDESQLVADVDYTVECSNNISVGIAEMTITGMGRYVGSISKTFKIVPKEITIAWGTQTSFVYNGTEQVPTATAKGLVNGDKCTITVSGAAKNAGSYTAKATVECNDNYNPPTKNLEKPFEITPKEVSITWGEQASFVYNGTEQSPTATAKGLVNGDKCTITVSGAAKNAGSYTAKATELSNGNYKLPTENLEKPFEITPKEITITWGELTFIYNGSEQSPTATADGLVNGDKCTITVSGAAKNAGSYTAKATELSNGNYKLPTENLEKPFEITPKEITIAWGEQTSFVYNGMEQSPTATAEGLINGDECTITVSGAAKNAGKHTAKATELSNGNYKLPTENLEKPFVIVINLASLESDFVAQDGEALTGELLASDYRIEIADGATVTLYSVLIYDVSRPGISCKGDCDIILAENSENTVMGSSGIYVPGGHTLTISGTGFLDVRGYDYAGIGCDLEGVAGNITISGGSITATGGYTGAGIGCSLEGVVENITISGGTITATGGYTGAGIGGGYKGTAGNITISGGTITAKGDGDGAGLGSGAEGSVKNITISGGTITATGGYTGAGIGGGYKGTVGNIEVTGGTITATGDDGGAGIGGGIFASVEDIMISGGTITATGDDGGAGIGSGRQGSVKNITISGGKVTANAGSNSVGIGSWIGASASTPVILSWTNEDDFIYASSYGNGTIKFSDGKSFYYEEEGKKVIVKSSDNIGGKTLRPFDGNKKSLKYAFVSGVKPYYHYTGEEINLMYRVTDFEGNELVEGTDYTALLNNTPVKDEFFVKDVDDYTLTITAKDGGVYTGSKTVKFSVVKFDFEDAVVSGVKPYYLYTGEEIALTYKVSDTEGKELVEGADYTAIFSPLPIRDKGDYTLTIAAKDDGVYTGKKIISFTVVDEIPVTVTTTEMTNGIYRVSSDVTIDDRIVITGYVMLVLDEGITLTASKGIEVSSKNKLTIDGKGSLNAIGVDNTAGIGSGYDETGGTVTINGGTITATGGKDAAGIGSGCYGTSVTVTINGGTITATGGEYAAGIGSGYDGTSVTVTINGGTITATGGKDAAGVGSGYYGTSGTVTINGGTITATGGKWAAGVGGGYCGSVGNIAINGDETKVTATKGENAPYSIGEGYGGSRTGSITIGGIETSDIAMAPFEYPYLMLVYEDGEDKKHAVLNGEYNGTEEFKITEDIQNVAVTFNRNFTVDLEKGGFSTLMLPFSVSTEDVGGLGGVYKFAYVADCDGDKKNDVCISKVWEDLDTKHQTLKAYTPYMVRMKESTLKINKNVTLAKTSGGAVYDQRMQTEEDREGSWQMRGVFGYKEWACNDDELGKVWGYTGEPRDGQKIGKYMKFGKGVWINPFRAYLFDPNGEQLKCTDESNTDGSKLQSIAASPYAKAYTADFLPAPAKSAANATASSEMASLDEFGGMQVVLIDGESGNERPTVIGRMNPTTGGVRMLPRTKQTYDLKGRRMKEGKKAKGAYYNRR